MLLEPFTPLLNTVTDSVLKLRLVLSTVTSWNAVNRFQNQHIQHLFDSCKSSIVEAESLFQSSIGCSSNSNNGLEMEFMENVTNGNQGLEPFTLLSEEDMNFMEKIESGFNETISSVTLPEVLEEHILNNSFSESTPLGSLLIRHKEDFAANTMENKSVQFVLSLPLDFLDDDPYFIETSSTLSAPMTPKSSKCAHDSQIRNNTLSQSLLSSLDLYSLLRHVTRDVKQMTLSTVSTMKLIFPKMVEYHSSVLIKTVESVFHPIFLTFLIPLYRRTYFSEDRILYRKLVAISLKSFDKLDGLWITVCDKVKSGFEIKDNCTYYQYLSEYEVFAAKFKNLEYAKTISEKIKALVLACESLSNLFLSLSCDEFIDGLILALIYCQPKNLVSEVQLILDLIDNTSSLGPGGFILTSLICSIDFIIRLNLNLEDLCSACAGQISDSPCACSSLSSSSLPTFRELSVQAEQVTLVGNDKKPVVTTPAIAFLTTPNFSQSSLPDSPSPFVTPRTSLKSRNCSFASTPLNHRDITAALKSIPSTPTNIQMYYTRIAEESYKDLIRASDPSLIDTDGWQKVSTTVVSKRNEPLHVYRKAYVGSSIFAFKGQGVIQCHVNKILKLLMDPRNRQHYDEMFAGCDVIDYVSDNTKVLLMKFRAKKWCRSLTKEFLILYHYRTLNDGSGGYALPGRSVAHKKCPSSTAIGRGKIYVGGWILKPSKANPEFTDACYVAHIDLCESYIPNWLQNMINSKQPLLKSVLRTYAEETAFITKLDNVRYRIEPGFVSNMNVPGIFYANEKLAHLVFDELEHFTNSKGVGGFLPAVKQISNVAALPGIVKYSIGLPDVHSGYGFSIGNTAAFDMENPESIVSPGGVGFDINCGVRLIRTNLDAEDVIPIQEQLAQSMFDHIPVGVGSKGVIPTTNADLLCALEMGMDWSIREGYSWAEDKEHCEEYGRMLMANPNKVSQRAKKRGLSQLGTLGAGNHYAEIQVVEEIYDIQAAKVMGIDRVGQVCIMVHSGSRGLGHQVATDALQSMESSGSDIKLNDKQLACAHINSTAGQDYLESMSAAANYAWVNRSSMTFLIRQAFAKAFSCTADDLDMHVIYDVSHNIAKIEQHSLAPNEKPKQLLVHRKGATRAFPPNHPLIPVDYQNIGQPVLVGGTMGTCSFVLTGTEQGMNETFGSTCHGAGRAQSRNKARNNLDFQDVLNSLKEKGISIRVASPKLVMEEAPESYKDVIDVVNTCHEAGISKKCIKLKPIAVIKGAVSWCILWCILAMQSKHELFGINQMWGFTPAVDLLSTYPTESSPTHSLHLLLAGTSDIRHILATIASGHEHVHFYMMEDTLECLARHLLFLLIFHDEEIVISERVQLFLEIYGNALLRAKTKAYLDAKVDELIKFMSGGQTVLTDKVDLTEMKYKERDEMEAIMLFWRKNDFDIVHLRDLRLRREFAERYDFRVNLIDWDYNMLVKDVSPIIHVVHYTSFRNTGQSFEIRECEYSIANATLASKRSGHAKGNPVLVRGFWSDALVGCFSTFGCNTFQSQRPDLFEMGNMQYKHTEMDVAEAHLSSIMESYEKNPVKYKVSILPNNEQVLSRAKYNELFSTCALGLCANSALSKSVLNSTSTILKQGSQLSVDSSSYLFTLKPEEKELYCKTLISQAKEGGWKLYREEVIDKCVNEELEGRVVFIK